MTAAKQVPDSVLDNLSTSEHTVSGRIGRRLVLGLLTIFILLAALQVFDRDTSGSSATGQFTVTVEYPATARPGLSGILAVHIHSKTPITGPFNISTSEAYLGSFSLDDISLAAKSETYANGYRNLSFDAPQERDFTLKLRGTWATDSGMAVSGAVEVAMDGGRMATVHLDTWLAF